jgi:hypothetical protein
MMSLSRMLKAPYLVFVIRMLRRWSTVFGTSSRCPALRANRSYHNPADRQCDENEDDDVADRHVSLPEETRCSKPRYRPGLRNAKSPRAVRRRKRESINEFKSASHVRGSRLQSR